MKDVKSELPQILIAEDNDSNYLLFEFLLKNDYQLFHARDGKEAVELFMLNEPQLILMDIIMPGTDGYQATAAIRELSPSIPIIAVTACAFLEDKEKIMSSGFNDYITKPINSTLLKQLIKEYLN